MCSEGRASYFSLILSDKHDRPVNSVCLLKSHLLIHAASHYQAPTPHQATILDDGDIRKYKPSNPCLLQFIFKQIPMIQIYVRVRRKDNVILKCK